VTRKWVGCFLAVLLVAVTSLACVSRGTYQEAVQARDQLNQQLSTVTKERDGLQSSLSAANADLEAAQGDLRNLQQAYDAFNGQVKEAQKYWDVGESLLLLLQAQGSGSAPQTVVALGKVVISVRDTGNDQLVSSWGKVVAAMNSLGQDAALLDFLALLGQKLAETTPQTK
jgi:hypothetical protein